MPSSIKADMELISGYNMANIESSSRSWHSPFRIREFALFCKTNLLTPPDVMFSKLSGASKLKISSMKDPLIRRGVNFLNRRPKEMHFPSRSNLIDSGRIPSSKCVIVSFKSLNTIYHKITYQVSSYLPICLSA
jgi:hypothetical protein